MACSNRAFCASARMRPGQMLPAPCGQAALHFSPHHLRHCSTHNRNGQLVACSLQHQPKIDFNQLWQTRTAVPRPAVPRKAAGPAVFSFMQTGHPPALAPPLAATAARTRFGLWSEMLPWNMGILKAPSHCQQNARRLNQR